MASLLNLNIECYQRASMVKKQPVAVRGSTSIELLLWFLKVILGLDGTLYFKSQNIGFKKKKTLNNLNIQNGDVLDLKHCTVKTPNLQICRIQFSPSMRRVDIGLPPNITFECFQFVIECSEKVMVEHQHIEHEGNRWVKGPQDICTKGELSKLVVRDTSKREHTPHNFQLDEKDKKEEEPSNLVVHDALNPSHDFQLNKKDKKEEEPSNPHDLQLDEKDKKEELSNLTVHDASNPSHDLPFEGKNKSDIQSFPATVEHEYTTDSDSGGSNTDLNSSGHHSKVSPVHESASEHNSASTLVAGGDTLSDMATNTAPVAPTKTNPKGATSSGSKTASYTSTNKTAVCTAASATSKDKCLTGQKGKLPKLSDREEWVPGMDTRIAPFSKKPSIVSSTT